MISETICGIISLRDSTGMQRERTQTIGRVRELSKRQAREKLTTHIKSFRANSQMSFEAAARSYIDLRRARWGKNHRQSICSILDCQINPILGRRCVAEISPAEIQTFLNKLADFGSESLIKKTVTHIRGVFDMLVEERILDRNPAKSKIVYRPDTRAVDKRYLELWECKSLLETAKNRDYLILRLFFSAALRPSELFALRVNDIGRD